MSLRVKINVTGIVQGVGFRPFIYRLAVRNGLAGYVRNRGDAGVEVLLEGRRAEYRMFHARFNRREAAASPNRRNQ